ncbi:MAG: type II secretion system protein [Candidatus Riflebacteria bacterium]|nr:type II secretion system protein [Candidatus Riflebacteria bacterium]
MKIGIGMKYKRKAFTLVELIIAFGVFALLLAFIYPILFYSRSANNTLTNLDVYHDVRRVDQAVFDELKLGSGVLYPPKPEQGIIGEWYPQLIFRNHLNQIIMLYVNKKNKLIIFNYDDVKGAYLSLGKPLGSNIKEFVVRRQGSSVIEYRLTFEIDKRDFVIANQVTLVNVF